MSEENGEESGETEQNQDDIEEPLIEPQVSSNSKWKKILGAFMALGSSLVFTFNGLLIKKFQLDLVDTLFVRSMIQSTLLLIFLQIRGISFCPMFDEGTTAKNKCWIYFILVFQVRIF